MSCLSNYWSHSLHAEIKTSFSLKSHTRIHWQKRDNKILNFTQNKFSSTKAMIKIQNEHHEYRMNVFHMYSLRCTNLFEQLNKMKVIGSTLVWVCFGGRFFVCLFVFDFVWVFFSLLLLSGLKTSSKVFSFWETQIIIFPTGWQMTAKWATLLLIRTKLKGMRGSFRSVSCYINHSA